MNNSSMTRPTYHVLRSARAAQVVPVVHSLAPNAYQFTHGATPPQTNPISPASVAPHAFVQMHQGKLNSTPHAMLVPTSHSQTFQQFNPAASVLQQMPQGQLTLPPYAMSRSVSTR